MVVGRREGGSGGGKRRKLVVMVVGNDRWRWWRGLTLTSCIKNGCDRACEHGASGPLS